MTPVTEWPTWTSPFTGRRPRPSPHRAQCPLSGPEPPVSCPRPTPHASPWSWPTLESVSSFLYKLNVFSTTFPVLLSKMASCRAGQKGSPSCPPVHEPTTHEPPGSGPSLADHVPPHRDGHSRRGGPFSLPSHRSLNLQWPRCSANTCSLAPWTPDVGGAPGPRVKTEQGSEASTLLSARSPHGDRGRRSELHGAWRGQRLGPASGG